MLKRSAGILPYKIVDNKIYVFLAHPGGEKVNDWSIFENNNYSLVNIGRAVNIEGGKIAPGSNGEFDIVIDARESKKELKYKIKIKETGEKPDNLQFRVMKNGNLEKHEYNSLKELSFSSNTI